MGAKLFPYLANIFIAKLEEKVKDHSLFPGAWLRYVEMFVATKERYVPLSLKLLYKQQYFIKFTFKSQVGVFYHSWIYYKRGRKTAKITSPSIQILSTLTMS